MTQPQNDRENVAPPTGAPVAETDSSGAAATGGERVRPGVGRRILGIVLILVGILLVLGMVGQFAQPQSSTGATDATVAMGALVGRLIMLVLAGLLIFFGIRMQRARVRR